MDGAVVVIGVVLLTAVGALWVAAIVDVAIQPDGAWRAVGRRRKGWVVGMILFGWIAGAVYFLSVRPGLRAAVAATLHPPPVADDAT